jgi:hypothetical protein
MEERNCLGMYLSKHTAAAVLLSARASGPAVLDYFSVSSDRNDEQSRSLASIVAQKIVAGGRSFNEMAVAIDCALLTQHDVHSEFTDTKQIAQTVRFDAEEALAADATELAIAFNITGTDQTGSDLTVFTANRQLLTDILDDLQAVNLDPAVIEPDIVCLERFFRHYLNLSGNDNPILTIFSQQSCYIIINPAQSQNAPIARSFLVGSSQDKTTVLATQIPLTLASLKLTRPVTSLLIAGRTEPIDYNEVAQRTGLEVQTIDLPKPESTGQDSADAQAADAEFAIAYGSALSELIKTPKADFRRDFAPYMGRKLILQKTLRLISVSITILMLVIGAYFQLKVFRQNNYTNRLDEKMRENYSTVMFGKNPPAQEPIPSRLKREYSTLLKREKGLIGDTESIPAKLTLIFEAINKSPEKIGLHIETITITDKAIRISGDTNKRSGTLSLFNTFKKKNLKILQQNLTQKGRDTFTITLELAQ